MGEVGFAAGYLPLPERLRVREFLRMFGQLYGVGDLGTRIATALERFGVGHLGGRLGTELSSGQRTLVGVVKATLHRPRLLVLDEPTASLDPDVARRVRAGLSELCDEEGTALLLTSHNMVEVERLCERVVFLSAGRVVADGRPSSVASRFGRRDLEGVFLHLAGEHLDEERPAGVQQTDRPA
jgi:ABC-2 type transport system ATP-binding protein